HVAGPGGGEQVDVGIINANLDATNNSYYIDVNFVVGATKALDYSTILDNAQEIAIRLAKTDGTSVLVTVNGTPIPYEINVVDGVSEVTLLSGVSNDALAAKGIRGFRYFLTGNGFQWEPGTVEVTFLPGSWALKEDSNPPTNPQSTESFTILGPQASLSNPSAGGHIKQNELQSRLTLDVTFAPTRTANAFVDLATPPTPLLSRAGLRTAAPAAA